MLKRISRWMYTLLFTAPRPVDGPFASAAAKVAAMESMDRARWEERDARWRAKSRAIHGPKAWNTDPAAMIPPLSAEKSGREEREKASGIVIDPCGTFLCRRCGHTVSAVHDHCINCCTPINNNAQGGT